MESVYDVAVQSIQDMIVIGGNMIDVPVQSKGALLDAFAYPRLLLQSRSDTAIVVADDNILNSARSIRHQQGNQASAVLHKICLDIVGVQCVERRVKMK